jgi:hypothetical protein
MAVPWHSFHHIAAVFNSIDWIKYWMSQPVCHNIIEDFMGMIEAYLKK